MSMKEKSLSNILPNSKEVMVFRKKGHPQNSEGCQQWEKTEVSDTLNVFDNSENRTPTLITESKTYDARGNGDGDVTCTITGGHQSTISDYTAIVCEPCNWDESQIAPTLTARNAGGCQRMPDKDNFQAVIDIQDKQVFDASRRHNYEPFDGVCETVQARYGTGGNNVPMVVDSEEKVYVVRRLTPLECTRLQGYPDRWVDIGDWTDENGKLHKDSDSAKYKALGNSLALPFWYWMAERMVNVLKQDGVENPTMAGLFSGIGGFELVFARNGCKPIWSSEIDSFPIAVMKKHFGDGENDQGDWQSYFPSEFQPNPEPCENSSGGVSAERLMPVTTKDAERGEDTKESL